MVPAVIEVWPLQALHWNKGLFFKRQWAVHSHFGHWNPFGQRNFTRAWKHWSSVPYSFKKVVKLSPFWNWTLFLLM